MRRPAIFAVFAALVLASCKDATPTSPAHVLTPVAPAMSNGADQSWVRVTFWNDHTLPVACLGENVRFFGYVPFQYHAVSNPSGGFNVTIQYRPETPNAPVFQGVGQTSGKVYVYSNGRPVNVSSHFAAGEVQTFISNERYEASDGSTLFGDARLHYTVNANGELNVGNDVEYELTCGRK